MMVALLFSLMHSDASAEIEPVAVRISEQKAWVGQRVSFFVELRSTGSFEGAASFELPQLPGVLVMKIGSPVVGSQELEGQSWLVQTHEFALFSQRSGPLVMPEFTTRFSRRDDFVGPVKDVQAECPSFRIEIERPPGSENVTFLITTESMEVNETWEPIPSECNAGAVFKRTIVQRATQLPGMAFAPLSSNVPDGVRFYAGPATTRDQLERGEFIGERRETVSYLLQRPGTFELPELNFVWWNPKTQSLESKTLPSVQIVVSASPTAETSEPVQQSPSLMWMLLGGVSLAIVSLFAFTLRQRIRAWLSEYWAKLNPPEQVAARSLQDACRSHNPRAACAAWSRWSFMQQPAFVPTPRLEAAVIELQRCVFGPGQAAQWNGNELLEAFGEQQRLRIAKHDGCIHTALPELNPTN